jgi:ADP-heptose:LPS heptosyltransferase
MLRLRRRLLGQNFDYGVSGRWDPRDHWVLKASGAVERLGFSRLQSRRYLTQELAKPPPLAHMSEYWREAGRALGLEVPGRSEIIPPLRASLTGALLHSGARLPARVWPLENFQQIAGNLRKKNVAVQIACDPDQRAWWQSHGENVACPQSVPELLSLIDQAGVFIGNCSGPGHLAAICGVPTFTLFGPSMPEWWLPMHPAAEIFAGKACPYKPCSDYCRYEKPFCLSDVKAADVWPRVEAFVNKHLEPAGKPSSLGVK